jgi:hypothetical protein
MVLAQLFYGCIVKVKIGSGKVIGAGCMAAAPGIAFYEFFEGCGDIGAGRVKGFFVLAEPSEVGGQRVPRCSKHQGKANRQQQAGGFFHGRSFN